MIDLKKYNIFYTVANSKNFTEASKKLYVTQSAVSQNIKAIEEQMGIVLFKRDKRNISLTDEGKRIYEHIDMAIKNINNASKIIDDIKNLNTGILKIGASDTICRYYLLKYLRIYRKKHPNINIELVNKPSPYVRELVENSKIDIGFINSYSTKSSKITYKFIQQTEEVFFTSKEYFKKILDLNNMSDYSFVTLNDSTSTRQILNEAFTKYNIKLKNIVEVINIDLSIDLVKNGFGIGFCDKKLLSKDLIILNTKIKTPKRNLYMLTNKNHIISNASNEFYKLF